MDEVRADQAFLAGGGELGALMRRHDWSASPLGAPSAWPLALRTAVGLMLNSLHPMFVAWGPQLGFLYNDAYRPILGSKHPRALGQPFADIWSEIWRDVEPLVERARDGEATWRDDLHLVMERSGYPEDTWYSFSYSPLRDGDGRIAGMFCACQETTTRVLTERRDAFLLRLEDALRGVVSPEEMKAVAAEALGRELGVSRVCYADVDDAAGLAHVAREWSDGSLPVMAGTSVRAADTGPLFATLRAGRTLVLSDLATDPRAAAVANDPVVVATRVRGVLDVPLVKNGTLVAILSANHAKPRRWSDWDVRLAESVAERTWAASERARAERVVIETEARFRNMADHSPVMMWVTEADGSCSYLNRSWYEFTGQTEAEALGHGWLEALLPEDRAEAGRLCAEAHVSAAPFRVDYRLRHRDGSYRWAIDAAAPRFGPDGAFLGYIGSVLDVSEARAASEAVHESEARLRTLTNAMPAFVWFATSDGKLHYLNDRWYEYTGQAEAEALGGGWTVTLHPDDARPTQAAWDRASMRGETYEVECRYRRHDGAYRWYLARAEPLRDADGEVVSWIGTSTDIHDRKLAESALHDFSEMLEARVARRTAELGESERRFRAIFDTTFQLTGLAALDGTILVVNRAALEAVEATAEQIVGLKMWDSPWWRSQPDEVAKLREGIARVARGQFVRYESVHQLPVGDRCFDFSMKPVLDDAGRPAFLVAEGRDVTDQKQAEAALRQAQKMEAVGQLTGGIAHDFNNLLGALVGSLDLIRRKPDDAARVKRYADIGFQAAERGAALTAQLLAFSRAQRIELRPLVVAELILGMKDLLARTLGPMVRLHLRPNTDKVAVQSDRTQLELAILNLAINARDAMPDGGDLTISASRRVLAADPELMPGPYVEIAVTDTGAGMAPEIAARAFDPFFTTKAVGKGTGLGLSQVYGTARQSGGTVRIESRPGAGATVVILLKQTPTPVPTHDTPAPGAAPPSPPPTRILVVDDDPQMRRVLVDSLESLGYGVVDAADGPAGLAALERERPDMMLVDFAMPGMNGAEVARAARERDPFLPIVFASGYADTAAIEAAAGPEAVVLRKPFRISDLQAALVGVLGAPRAVVEADQA